MKEGTKESGQGAFRLSPTRSGERNSQNPSEMEPFRRLSGNRTWSYLDRFR